MASHNDEKVYNCICGSPNKSQDWICCDSRRCTTEWFHFECVNVTDPPKGEWLCPKCRGEAAGNETAEPATAKPQKTRPKKGVAVKKASPTKGKEKSRGLVEMPVEEGEGAGEDDGGPQRASHLGKAAAGIISQSSNSLTETPSKGKGRATASVPARDEERNQNAKTVSTTMKQTAAQALSLLEEKTVDPNRPSGQGASNQPHSPRTNSPPSTPPSRPPTEDEIPISAIRSTLPRLQ